MARKTAAAAKAAPPVEETPAAPANAGQVEAVAVELPLHLIDDNPDNPRPPPATDAEKAEDEELTASIGARGVLEPIMVRPSPADPERFIVVMGARRRRCSLAAGKLTIPAMIRRDLTDAQAFELSVIENDQRSNMNAMATARAYRRMIDDRLAADPKLTFKAAKEDVARVVGKSVRIIELRLEFLEKLPPIKQVELERGAISAKEATAWIRDQPKARDLKPDVALAVVEAAWMLAKKKNVALYDRIDVRHDHPKDPAPGLIAFNLDYQTCRHRLALTNGAFEHLQALTGSETPLRREALRPVLLAARRAYLGGPDRPETLRDLEKDGYCLTVWLNGPFEPDPEAKAAQDRQRAADEARRQQWAREDQERRERDAAAAKERDRRDREDAERAEKILQAVRAFEDDCPGLDAAAFAEAFRELQASLGYRAPFSVSWNGREPVLQDADGNLWTGSLPVIEGLRRIMAIAVNYACGLAPISGEPLTDTPWAIQAREDAEADDADDADAEDPADQAQPPPSEPAPESADPDAPATEDAEAESPAFLRRLAGAGDAEARP